MKTARLPLIFLVAGLVLKGYLVLLFRLRQIPELIPIVIDYDPGGFWFAEQVTPLFFDPRRFAPTLQEAFFFDVLLVVGFGIECFLIGLLIRWVYRQRTSSHHLGGSGGAPRPPLPCAGAAGGKAGIVPPPSSVNVNSRWFGLLRAVTDTYCFPSSM